MKELSPLRRTIGLVLIMIGGFWVALSLGFLEESFMTGNPVWSVIGALIVTAGFAVLYLPRKKKGVDPGEEPKAPGGPSGS